MAPRGKKPPPGRSSQTETKPTVSTSLPNWPAFKPLLPASMLSLTTLLPSQIIVIRNFWTSTLCKNYVSFVKTLPLVTTPGKPKKGEALRVNDRFSVEDWAFAERLWRETGLLDMLRGSIDAGGDRTGVGQGDGMQADGDMDEQGHELKELWGGEVVGLNPMIRVYRYTKGQFFDCHYDESNILSLPTTPKATPARTTWTLLLYLTSPATGCQGGQTVFYPEEMPRGNAAAEKEVVVELETGMLLLHKHGNDCLLHEGREVTEGEKWVIRSDLCIRR